jgi:hypothetical protein
MEMIGPTPIRIRAMQARLHDLYDKRANLANQIRITNEEIRELERELG